MKEINFSGNNHHSLNKIELDTIYKKSGGGNLDIIDRVPDQMEFEIDGNGTTSFKNIIGDHVKIKKKGGGPFNVESPVGKYANFKISGNGNTTFCYAIGVGATIEKEGGGELKVKIIESQANIIIKGNGNVIINEIKDNATVTKEGGGALRIDHLGSNSNLTIDGNGDVEIGDIGPGTVITKSGGGNLIIPDSIDKTIQLNISGRGGLKHVSRPPKPLSMSVFAPPPIKEESKASETTQLNNSQYGNISASEGANEWYVGKISADERVFLQGVLKQIDKGIYELFPYNENLHFMMGTFTIGAFDPCRGILVADLNGNNIRMVHANIDGVDHYAKKMRVDLIANKLYKDDVVIDLVPQDKNQEMPVNQYRCS